MTTLLERALARARKLPDSEQDALAAIMLEEIERLGDEQADCKHLEDPATARRKD